MDKASKLRDKHAGKSAKHDGIKSKFNKWTWLFIRYLRVLLILWNYD